MNKLCAVQSHRSEISSFFILNWGSDIKGRINNKSYLDSSVNSTSVALFAPNAPSYWKIPLSFGLSSEEFSFLVPS